jgi:hypothetical protein
MLIRVFRIFLSELERSPDMQRRVVAALDSNEMELRELAMAEYEGIEDAVSKR